MNHNFEAVHVVLLGTTQQMVKSSATTISIPRYWKPEKSLKVFFATEISFSTGHAVVKTLGIWEIWLSERSIFFSCWRSEKDLASVLWILLVFRAIILKLYRALKHWPLMFGKSLCITSKCTNFFGRMSRQTSLMLLVLAFRMRRSSKCVKNFANGTILTVTERNKCLYVFSVRCISWSLQRAANAKHLQLWGHCWQRFSSSPMGQSTFPSHTLPMCKHLCGAFLHLNMPMQTDLFPQILANFSSSPPGQFHKPSHTYFQGRQ